MLNRFPFDSLRVCGAGIGSSLDFNPYPPPLPPKQRWSIELAIDPITLGSAAADPEIETTVDSPIVLSDIELPVTSWKSLPGNYTFSPPSQGGSFYVSDRHNPVDLSRLCIRNVRDNVFALELDLHFDFAFEDAGYENAQITLAVEAPYSGFSFIPPLWTNPKKVLLPPDWGVPSKAGKWPEADLRQFLALYVDLSAFSRVEIEETPRQTIFSAFP